MLGRKYLLLVKVEWKNKLNDSAILIESDSSLSLSQKELGISLDLLRRWR